MFLRRLGTHDRLRHTEQRFLEQLRPQRSAVAASWAAPLRSNHTDSDSGRLDFIKSLLVFPLELRADPPEKNAGRVCAVWLGKYREEVVASRCQCFIVAEEEASVERGLPDVERCVCQARLVPPTGRVRAGSRRG